MATVGLISCVSKKLPHSATSEELYKSPLFTKAREYIKRRCDNWFILSAKYGLVPPTQVISPYEETLNSKSRIEREQWAERVWVDLRPLLNAGDHVIILAGERYREFLLSKLFQHGCTIEVPMKGLGIGRQLQWLSQQISQPQRKRDLERLYASLKILESGVGGKRLLSACTGQHTWPRNGVYCFFEENEFRSNGNEQRVVRVGTHGVSGGSKATLWNRLRTHRGTAECLGNHRGSIFRLHVGAALAAHDASLYAPTWGVGQTADATIRKREENLERAVSDYIGSMSILWLAIEDEAGPQSDRAYIERNLIGLLAGQNEPIDPPSRAWLGHFSPNQRIRDSGLWNLNFLDYSYSPEFLDVLDEYVLITVGKKPSPCRPIAPRDWHAKERLLKANIQLPLFEEKSA